MNDFDDIPKYRKRSSRPPCKKAKHRHQEAFCVLEYTTEELSKETGWYEVQSASIGTYCPICGKVKCTFTQDPKYTNRSLYWNRGCAMGREWNAEGLAELNPRTRTLPTFQVDDIWKVKYVNIEGDAV